MEFDAYYPILLKSFHGRVLKKEPMSLHTTYRIGGPADLLVFPKDQEDLITVVRFTCEYGIFRLILGRGSNLLVSDEGIQGVVVSLKDFCGGVVREGDTVRAGAAVPLRRLVLYGERIGLGGIEFLSGIPGTVGGGVRMNAGAFGGEIADRLLNIEAICPKGRKVIFQARDVGFRYRTAKGLEDHVILQCSFLLDICSPQAISERRRMLLQQRRDIQPLRYPSCGSVFRRKEGVLPGRLIDEAGCKGLRIGDALVSRKHANFIINRGSAKAQDIWSLIQEVKRRVSDRFGIELELEVQMVGRF